MKRIHWYWQKSALAAGGAVENGKAGEAEEEEEDDDDDESDEEEENKGPFFWVDVFAINQHQVSSK